MVESIGGGSTPTNQNLKRDNQGGIYANIRGLYPSTNKTKIPYLQDLAISTNSPFILLTETHLNPEILDAEIQIRNYNLYRSDRAGRSHGGVCIYVRNDLAASVIFKDSNSYCDSLILKIHQMNLLLVNIYRPPGCKSALFNQTLEAVKSTIKNIEEYDQAVPSILVFGDFNFPNINWKCGSGIFRSSSSSKSGEERSQAEALINFAEDFFLDQLIRHPTRNNNILDLIFTNDHQLIRDYNIICNNQLSDHYIIKFGVTCTSKKTCSEKISKSFYETNLNEYDFYNASEELWLRFNYLCGNINSEDLFEDASTQAKLEIFYDEVCKIVDIVFDKKNDVSKNDDNFTANNLIPRKIRVLMRNKAKISKAILAAKSGQRVTALKAKLHHVEDQLKNSYDKRRDNQEKDAVNKIKSNPGFFYSYAKKFSKIRSSVGPFLNDDNDIVDDNLKMAEMLKVQYEKSFSKPVASAVIEDANAFFKDEESDIDGCFSNVSFSYQDVLEAIDDLSVRAAPGPDCFPAILLKKGKYSLCHALTNIYKSSLETGEIPDILKSAFITPVFKGGMKSLPISYRPVSLTSHITKTFERIIRKSLVAFLEVNQKMNPAQHGFRVGRSCLSQLLEHYDQILKILETGENADCIYLDFAKCFDKIDIGLLGHKLKRIGIHSKIGVWLQNFLSSRNQYILVGDRKSSSSKVISGIPQGTVLGPVLALIFLSDIDSDVECIASMFCDDTRLLSKINSEEDVEIMQADLDKVFNWADNNNMKFNSEKFELLRYGKNEAVKENTVYFSGDENIIEEKEVLRDLGVQMNNQANFDDHISKVCQKVKQKSGWILRTFKTRSPFVMKVLWKQLVQPHIDYCSQLFMPVSGSKLSNLENLQRSFTSRIPAAQHLNYWERLKFFKLSSQQRRLERYRIIYLWKILEGRTPNCGICKVESSERIGRKCTIPAINKQASGRIQTLRENSFQVHARKLFNSLPKTLRNKSKCSIDEFKADLDKFLESVPDEPKVNGGSYTPGACDAFSAQASNSIIDQIRRIK